VIAYLDTNVAIWVAQGNLTRLSQPALQHLESDELLLSPTVLVELEYLFEIRRLLLPARDLLLKLEHELGLQLCPLAVESQQVVPFDCCSADGWRQAETSMRSVPVVLVQPGAKLLAAFV
jgi:hypothetical protein